MGCFGASNVNVKAHEIMQTKLTVSQSAPFLGASEGCRSRTRAVPSTTPRAMLSGGAWGGSETWLAGCPPGCLKTSQGGLPADWV